MHGCAESAYRVRVGAPPCTDFPLRALRRFSDYFFISAPLIAMAFAATGAALSMLLADMLQRVDVVRIIAGFLKTVGRPEVKAL